MRSNRPTSEPDTDSPGPVTPHRNHRASPLAALGQVVRLQAGGNQAGGNQVEG
jgi:hypothetical protein